METQKETCTPYAGETKGTRSTEHPSEPRWLGVHPEMGLGPQQEPAIPQSIIALSYPFPPSLHGITVQAGPI